MHARDVRFLHAKQTLLARTTLFRTFQLRPCGCVVSCVVNLTNKRRHHTVRMRSFVANNFARKKWEFSRDVTRCHYVTFHVLPECRICRRKNTLGIARERERFANKLYERPPLSQDWIFFRGVERKYAIVCVYVCTCVCVFLAGPVIFWKYRFCAGMINDEWSVYADRTFHILNFSRDISKCDDYRLHYTPVV